MEKQSKHLVFPQLLYSKVRAVMAWQDLYVSENEGHRDERKNLGRCEMMGCQESVMQLKSWLAAEVHVCPEYRAGNPSGEKPREVIASVQGFQNTILCGGNCGNEVLKSWGVKIRKDAVTWPGV